MEKRRTFRKILDHPSADLIVRLLKQGEGVRSVATKIKEMYPNDKTKHLTFVTLEAFRKEHLNIEGDALQIIKETQRERKIVREDRNLYNKEHAKLKKLPSYQEKLEEAIDLHIDIKQQLANLHTLMTARMETIFDKLANGEGSATTDEQNLQRYFQNYILILEKWAKYIDKVADYTVETNVNITVIEKQMTVLREAVWEIMKEMEPIMASKFLEKLDNKMKEINFRQDNKTNFQEIHNDIKVLNAKIEENND